MADEEVIESQSTALVLLEDAMNQLRHCQQMRAAYLNFYLVIFSASFAAFIAVSSSSTLKQQVSALLGTIIGVFVTIMGLISLMRAERWTGHILHNLFIYRRIRHELQQRTPMLKRVYVGNPKLAATDEFRKSPLDRSKSVDSVVAMVGAATGGLPFLLYAPPDRALLAVSVAVVMAISPIVVWWREVAYLEARHRECCLRIPSAAP